MVPKDSLLLVYYALRIAAKLGYGTDENDRALRNECDQSKTETKARNEFAEKNGSKSKSRADVVNGKAHYRISTTSP